VTQGYDKKNMRALEKIQGSMMDKVTTGMSVLPVKMGGRGIESLEVTAAASFIAKQLQMYQNNAMAARSMACAFSPRAGKSAWTIITSAWS
jgi:hypothetical protein